MIKFYKPKRFRLPHGLVFIHDMYADFEVPSDTDLSIVRATPTCISVWGTHEQEGKTEIAISNACPATSLELVFDGKLSTASKRVALTDSSATMLLSEAVVSTHSQISVYVDNIKYPKVIHLKIS